MSVLLMRLEGPLQSWGSRAQWTFRDSGDEPTKSGVVGLLGCALGLKRGDRRLEKLENQLTMGVRVEHPGTKLTDFHTITGSIPTAEGKFKDKEESTIISPRIYLQDAAFLVALSGSNDVLNECRDALIDPHWPVFLGRKSCPPTRPVFEGFTNQYSSCEAALRNYPWAWEGSGEGSKSDGPEMLKCVVEVEARNSEFGGANGDCGVRNDRLRVNPARMYDERLVRIFFVRREDLG